MIYWTRKIGSCFAPIVFLVGLANCGKLPGNRSSSCSSSVEPAVVVEIRDARTGASLAASATGVVRDNSYVDSLRPHEGRGTAPFALTSRAAADERPGTYSVQVYSPGYRMWAREGVRVTRDECHVRTQRLTAGLEPNH